LGAELFKDTMQNQFTTLPLAAIAPSLPNPRKHVDAVKLSELTESIKASGVHQPILVRPLPGSRVADTFDIHMSGGGLKERPAYEIVAGEQPVATSAADAPGVAQAVGA
jgi:hypothetical protein